LALDGVVDYLPAPEEK